MTLVSVFWGERAGMCLETLLQTASELVVGLVTFPFTCVVMSAGYGANLLETLEVCVGAFFENMYEGDTLIGRECLGL